MTLNPNKTKIYGLTYYARTLRNKKDLTARNN